MKMKMRTKGKKRENNHSRFRLRRKLVLLVLIACSFTTILWLGTRLRLRQDAPLSTLTVPAISDFLVNAANISVGGFNLKETFKEYHSYLMTTQEDQETEKPQDFPDLDPNSLFLPQPQEESILDAITREADLGKDIDMEEKSSESEPTSNSAEGEVVLDDDSSTVVPINATTSSVAEMEDNTNEGDATPSSDIKEILAEEISDTSSTSTAVQETKMANTSFPAEMDDSAKEAQTSSSDIKDNNEADGAFSSNIKENPMQVEEIDSKSTRNLEEAKSVNKMDDGTKEGETSSSNVKACDYWKGRWVADRRRPLYSGFKCKQWLSEMWACRLTQRTDFSYEGYRWQPYNCNLTEFEPSAFFQRMQNKTIAFVGDSLGRQQFQSLMCMATAGEWRQDVEDVAHEFGLTKPLNSIRPDGYAYRFSNTNTTILFYWTSTLADLDQPLNETVPMHLDRPPAFLKRFLHRFDVLVLNTGHHWNRGKMKLHKWVMHINGNPIKETDVLARIGDAKNFTIHSLVKWVDGQFSSHPKLKVLFRTISPRHFRHGEWNSGGNCDNTVPMSQGSEVVQEESSDGVIAAAVKGTRVQLLDITALSELRDEGHISRYSVKAKQGVNDCLHWCLPGIPDTWNELLFAMI